MKKITFFLGLNDRETRKQIITTAAAIKIVMNLIYKLVGGASVSKCFGVYTHENGEKIKEMTIKIEILDYDENAVKMLFKELQTTFNQESILIQKEVINAVFATGENDF